MKVSRSDIFLINMEHRELIGEVVPGVVVSNNMCNKHSPVISVVPILNKEKAKPYYILTDKINVEIELENGIRYDGVAVCYIKMPVDKHDLIQKIGRCTDETMVKIETGLIRSTRDENYIHPKSPDYYPDKDDVQVIRYLVNIIKTVDLELNHISQNKKKQIKDLTIKRKDLIDNIMYKCKYNRSCFEKIKKRFKIIESR